MHIGAYFLDSILLVYSQIIVNTLSIHNDT